jgi:hypothetical protein
MNNMWLKNMISVALGGMIRFLKWLNEFLTANANNPNPDFFEDLTPVSSADTDQVYAKTLIWALDNLNIRNLALTGPYGSGKSSILKTFEKEHPEYKYLNISLASFDDVSANAEDDRKRIEISILQQIFYRVSGNKTPDSRFKRIKSTNGLQLFTQAFLLLLCVVAGLIIFDAGFFDKISWWKNFYLKKGDLIYYVAATVFVVGTLVILKKLLRYYTSASFRKLNLKSGEIELASDVDASILNKHLDEILYFFERTGYNVVTLEDLDRFKDPEKIFSKLRELNNVINNSSQISRKVTFVYALADDVFTDDERTKFFDFFIPVIPVINSSNSGELLLKKFQDAKAQGNLSENFLMNITFFIEDMRQLKNVYNEYILYKKKLSLSLNEEKLFGIILYKNFYPTDFADLNVNKGLIYESFQNKKLIIKDLTDKIDQQIAIARQEIGNLENIQVENLTELRAIYLAAMQKKLPDSYRFQVNGVAYNFAQLDEEAVFEGLIKENSISTITINYGSWRGTGVSFKSIEGEVNAKKGYLDRKKEVVMKYSQGAEKLRVKIAKLSEDKTALENERLSDYISKDPKAAILPEVEKERILVYLLRHGYIDETYQSYISYFYEGTITRKDMDFVFSVKNFTALPPSYTLNKIDQMVKKLQPGDYQQREILNYDLLDFLASSQASYEPAYLAVIKQLSDNQPDSRKFVDDYLKVAKETGAFIKALCKQWAEIWDDLNNTSNFTIERLNDYLKLIIIHADTADLKTLNKSGRLKRDIQKSDEFLTLFPTAEHDVKIKALLRELEIEFSGIIYLPERKELYDYLYENSNYQINVAMLTTITKNYSTVPIDDEKLKEANYSAIKLSGCISLINRIDANINEYLGMVFFSLTENVKEQEKFYLELLSNPAIEPDDKISIIEKEETIIGKLSSLVPELWPAVFEGLKISATWDNVMLQFLGTKTIDGTLLGYLNSPQIYNQLAKFYMSSKAADEENSKALSIQILMCNELTDPAYQQFIRSIPWNWNSLSLNKISASKVDILISTKKINITQSNYDSLKINFNGKNIKLLENDFRKYKDLKAEVVFDDDDYYGLYNSEKLTAAQKKALLNEMDAEVITTNKLGATITAIVYKQKLLPVTYALLSKLVNYNNSIKSKIELVNLHFKEINKDQLSELLDSIGGDYKQITLKGPKPTIPATPENRAFAKLLDDSQYVSTIKEHKDKITINTWRKEK